MILLRDRSAASSVPWITALFGVGVVGSAIRRGLHRCARVVEEPYPLDWYDSSLRDRQLETIARRLDDLGREARGRRLHVVWAAGEAGFGADEEATSRELDTFRRIGRRLDRLSSTNWSEPPSFHLISSAGGLHEGQRFVHDPAQASPCRPYGRLKAAQESALAEWQAFGVRRTYRLSSVFGPVRTGQRKGLIPTLLRNGLMGRVTFLSGLPTTLRDFVWADDVGRHVAQRILDVDPVGEDRTVEILASGRPTPLMAIIQAVEDLLGRKLYVRMHSQPANTSHITFSHAVLPASWSPRHWQSGVRQVYDDLLAVGVADPRAGTRHG